MGLMQMYVFEMNVFEMRKCLRRYLRKLYSILFNRRTLIFYKWKQSYTGKTIPNTVSKELIRVLKPRIWGKDDPLNILIGLLKENIHNIDVSTIARITYRLNDLLYERWSDEEKWVKMYIQDMLMVLSEAKREGCGIRMEFIYCS